MSEQILIELEKLQRRVRKLKRVVETMQIEEALKAPSHVPYPEHQEILRQKEWWEKAALERANILDGVELLLITHFGVENRTEGALLPWVHKLLEHYVFIKKEI